MSLYHNRLEAGKFIWPVSRNGASVPVPASQPGYPFRVVKRQFGYVTTRYCGLARNRARLFTLFALGKAAAIACILIETAKINAVDPHAWLGDALARIPDYKITQVDDLLPWRWNG